MPTIATMFSGGEGVGVGARMAGLRHLWGIEWRPDVAQVARDNGFYSIVANVRALRPGSLEQPDVLHASPPCLDASGANGKRIESEEGKTLGMVIQQYIQVLLPHVFTLENVWYYRNYAAFKGIVAKLFELGYMVDVQHLNAADFSVPQTRKRLILRAVRNELLPRLPPKEPWVGWYAAVEDLIPTFKKSQLVPWQLARLPEGLKKTVILSQGISRDHKGNEYKLPVRSAAEPSPTITANQNMLGTRAFLMPGSGNTGKDTARPGKGVRGPQEPATTVTAIQGGGTLPRAFIVSGGNSDHLTLREADEPAHTVVAHSDRAPTRAFLVGSHYAQPNTVPDREVQTRDAEDPASTITATYKGDKRAWLDSGRVVVLSVRALARLQSFPDSYILPDKKTLACYVIGNACPPLMMEKIYRQFLESF